MSRHNSCLGLSSHTVAFQEADFVWVRDQLRRRAGISLGRSGEELIRNRLSRRLSDLQLSDFSDYRKRLAKDPGEAELFLNALTTNVTAFFREDHHFCFLKSEIATKLRSPLEPLRIWSAGCSSGEEAYSIAIALIEAGANSGAGFRVLGTDIDTRVLKRARRGVYQMSALDKVADARKRRFFLRGHGTQAGLAKVHPEVQKHVQFEPLNLVEPWGITGDFHVIFCRNVLIYFSSSIQADIVARLRTLLHADGYLLVGHSESLAVPKSLFRPVAATIYQKRDSDL